MPEKPDESEVALFRSIMVGLMRLQHQLYPACNSDRQLFDRLFDAEDRPSIQGALRDRTPR